jgi:antitoxin (DNA-binding transcriptional repressor) of toxin-antitoxin stability system
VKTVGIRELKNRLSDYLRQVRSGEAVLVTDRGQVVAELTLPNQSASDTSVATALVALARRSLVVLGAPNRADLYPRLPRSRRRRRAAQLLDDERGAR